MTTKHEHRYGHVTNDLYFLFSKMAIAYQLSILPVIFQYSMDICEHYYLIRYSYYMMVLSILVDLFS